MTVKKALEVIENTKRDRSCPDSLTDIQIAFEKVHCYVALEKTTFNRGNSQAVLHAINLMFDICTLPENEVAERYTNYREIIGNAR